MRISDWSSDVCSSDLRADHRADQTRAVLRSVPADRPAEEGGEERADDAEDDRQDEAAGVLVAGNEEACQRARDAADDEVPDDRHGSGLPQMPPGSISLLPSTAVVGESCSTFGGQSLVASRYT